jgi:hypothetical protein
MFEHLLVFLVQRFRRLDSSARWYSVSRISIGLLSLSSTPATRLPALGFGPRPFARAADMPLQRGDAVGCLVGSALELLVVISPA